MKKSSRKPSKSSSKKGSKFSSRTSPKPSIRERKNIPNMDLINDPAPSHFLLIQALKPKSFHANISRFLHEKSITDMIVSPIMVHSIEYIQIRCIKESDFATISKSELIISSKKIQSVKASDLKSTLETLTLTLSHIPANFSLSSIKELLKYRETIVYMSKIGPRENAHYSARLIIKTTEQRNQLLAARIFFLNSV